MREDFTQSQPTIANNLVSTHAFSIQPYIQGCDVADHSDSDSLGLLPFQVAGVDNSCHSNTITALLAVFFCCVGKASYHRLFNMRNELEGCPYILPTVRPVRNRFAMSRAGRYLVYCNGVIWLDRRARTQYFSLVLPAVSVTSSTFDPSDWLSIHVLFKVCILVKSLFGQWMLWLDSEYKNTDVICYMHLKADL